MPRWVTEAILKLGNPRPEAEGSGFAKPRQQGRTGEAVGRDVVGTGTTARVKITTHRQTLKCRLRIQISIPGMTFDRERTH